MKFTASILQRCLEVITIFLLVALAVVVIVAVSYRVLGSSLIWYDEVASVMLAWITYFGAGLAALKRSHLGFPGLVLARGKTLRIIFFLFGEIVIYAVFITMAWAGWHVLEVMEGETLIALEWVSIGFTQSIVPIGCGLFVVAQFLSTPVAWQRILNRVDVESEEIEREIEKAQRELDAKGVSSS